MRFILILLVIIAAFVIIQNQRHGCKWGQEGWMDCVLGRTAAPAATPAAEETPAPAPAPEPAPAPAPQ